MGCGTDAQRWGVDGVHALNVWLTMNGSVMMGHTSHHPMLNVRCTHDVDGMEMGYM